MGAQHQGACVLCAKFRHHPVPQQPRRAQLGHLHEEIHTDGEKERQPWCEGIHIHAACQRRFHIFAPVGQRKAQFLHKVRAGLLHVVAGDGDRVELWHLSRRIGDDIRHDAHRWFRRIDIGVAHHEFLQDVVLYGARQRTCRYALLLPRHNETGQHRDDRAIHRHGHADPVQGDAVEQDFHILDRVDGHARLADIAYDPWMIRVVAPVRRQIKGHRHALLPTSQRRAVKGVAFLGRGKARILADGPGAACVHRGADATRIRGDARQAVQVIQTFQIMRGIQGLDRNAFQRGVGQAVRIAPAQLACRKRAPCCKIIHCLFPTRLHILHRHTI